MNQVLNHLPRKVSSEMNELLPAPYDMAEVKSALFQMFPTKAPRLDGFPAHFFSVSLGCVENKNLELDFLARW
jgi:hypothetical protein